MQRLIPVHDVQEDDLRGFKRLASFFEHRVGSIVPEGFEGYARVFHPAWRVEAERRVPLRWTDLANYSGAKPHSLMQWRNISVPSMRGAKVELPDSGTLPSEVSRPLQDILSRHLEQDYCWLGVWPGFGGCGCYRKHVPPTLAIDMGPREWDLFRAPLSMMDTPFYDYSDQTANLIWCDGPGWWATPGIELDSTYIGGDRKLIEDILESPALEAFPVSPDDDITMYSDKLNASDDSDGDFGSL